MINQKWKSSALALALVASSWSLTGFSIAPASARPETTNITVSEEHIGSQPYQVSRVLIKARAEHVWQVITDYSGAPNIFSNVKKCQVLADKGLSKLIRFQVKPSGLLASYEYDLDVREQPNRLLEWHRVAGDFKSVDGFWKLEPADCGRSTLVTYATYVNGGIFMPQAFIKRQSHIDVPQVMAALKNRAETTMHLASHGTHSAN